MKLHPIAAAGLALLFVSATPPAEYADWTILPVPGTWDEHSDGKLGEYDGFAWYRCLVTVPGGWKGKELELQVAKVDNAHEAYFNGVKVGSAGSFPPDYRSGLDATGRYVIKPEIVKPGKNNVLAIRVYDHEGRGGFKDEAPVIIAGEQAISTNGRWEFRTGDDVEWAKGPTKLTSVGIFWRAFPAKDVIKGFVGSGALPPAAAAKTFTVPDDLEWELVLAEPQVRQPTFLNFDERGRMWVMNFVQYPYPNGLKIVSKDEFWRSVYDKVPEPPPHGPKGTDTITIHEDTDGDGTFDKHKVFLDNLNIASSFVKGRGGVWVLNPPYLLFYPDRDNDDVPDGDPEVHLTGFGMEDTHSIVNSLRWGPDGWLYGAQGSTVTGTVTRPGSKDPPVHSMGQLIFRYHPEARRYEIFAEGGGNSFGVEIDAKGRIYSGHNGGDTRGFHYVQGAYLQKGFTKHGPLSNPYAFGFFGAMKHHSVPRFSHNFVIYEAEALPDAYRGKLFGIEPLQGRVVMSEISPDGSSYQTKDLGHPVTSTDTRFRPVDIKIGPDGAIYVADFYEPQISHREHFSGQIDKATGRIWRLKEKGSPPLRGGKSSTATESRPPVNFGKLSMKELIETLGDSNRTVRQTALAEIAERKDASAIQDLRMMVHHNTGQLALECLWALHVSGGLTEDFALETLHHADPHVRAWTVRLLGDERNVSPAIAAKLVELAGREEVVQVRSQLASTAKRLPAKSALPLVRALLTHDEDVDDIHLPLLLWWALESKAGSDRDAVLALFEDSETWRLPIVQQHILSRIMQRFAMAGTRADLLAAARLLELAPEIAHRDALMQGFEAAFKGRPLTGLPPELVQALAKAGGGSLVLRMRQGDAAAIDEALKTIADAKADPAKRLEYIQTLGEVNQPEAVPVLLEVVKESDKADLRQAALTALQAYPNEEIGAAVVGIYGKLSGDVLDVAQTLLASRAAWSRRYLEAVDAGAIAADAVPLDVVRKMTIHRDDRIAALLRKHWSKIEGASSAEMQQEIARLTEVLKEAAADPHAGKALYKQTCAKCHTMFGQGGRIGPDLTTYKRDDLTQMLVHIVNPSAEVREGFETFIIITVDGRAVTGFLSDQDNRVVSLRGADGQTVTFPRDQIEEMVPQRKSIMPEGLLKDLSDQEIRDLFAYLRSTQPIGN